MTAGYVPTCIGCQLPTTGSVELDFTDDKRRSFACCDACTVDGVPSLRAILTAWDRFGAMPLNPKAAPRVCPLCDAPDERKCGCL